VGQKSHQHIENKQKISSRFIDFRRVGRGFSVNSGGNAIIRLGKRWPERGEGAILRPK
jgi:hypothetical protein